MIRSPLFRTHRIGLLLFAVSASLGAAPPAAAQRYDAADLMPLSLRDRLGLQQAWVASTNVGRGLSGIVDQVVHLDRSVRGTFVEVTVPVLDGAASATGTSPETGDAPAPAETNAAAAAAPAPTAEVRVLSRYRLGSMGPDGRMIDQKEADRLADNEIRRLKRRGYEPSKRQTEAIRVVLYTLSDDGSLESRDGETGELNWVVFVGSPSLGYGALGVGDRHVVVTNGANLNLVDASTGAVRKTIRTRRPPRFGAAIGGKYCTVHTVGGNIEAYLLDDFDRDPFIEHVQGSALERPTPAPDGGRVAWSTDQQYVYVMELDASPSTIFRVRTDGLVVGRTAATQGQRFYAATDRGIVYGIAADGMGRMLWTEAIGEPVVQAPLVAEDRVLVLTQYGNLYALNLHDGSRLWERPRTGLTALHAAVDGRLYASTTRGFAVIDLRDATNVVVGGGFDPVRVLGNVHSDRMYVVGGSGAIQCLRPAASELPRQLMAEAAPVAATPESSATAGTATPKPTPTADPFGASAGSDPFGGGGGDDPFGAGGNDDPFGGGGDDPFGAGDGDDPFGGGGDDPFAF